MYQTIIVEDDPMVAAINRQYLEANPLFHIAGVFSNGQEALAFARQHPVDLAIVDYYMSVMNGKEFIQSCHDGRLTLDIIMVTAASSAQQIGEILQLGVVDYLIKPFTRERFCQAIQRFIDRQATLHGAVQLSQNQVDQLLSASSAEPSDVPLEKGLQVQTLRRITRFLENNSDRFLSSEEIAREVQLSRITVRRYVNHLMDTHQIVSQIDYSTGGRPSIKYKKM